METKNSPKNPYRVELIFEHAIPGLGSVVSHTAKSIVGCETIARTQVLHLKQDITTTVRIFKNKSEYPSFNWTKVASYELRKSNGKLIQIL